MSRPSRRAPRPRVLFLCQTYPFPPDSGVANRSYNVLRQLAEAYDVKALCFYRRRSRGGERELAEPYAELERRTGAEAFPIPQEHSKARMLSDHFRSLLSRTVYTRFVYSSAAFRRRVKEELDEGSYDLVHMDSLDLSAYLPDLVGVPVVCVHHNVESALLRRRADTEESPLRSAYLRLQSRLMEKEERRWCREVSLNVAVSGTDAEMLQRLVPSSHCAVVPNGVDTEFFQPDPQPSTGLVFVGGTTWFPNKDALSYFTSDILPLLRETTDASPVTWVGRASAEEQEDSRRAGISLTGYVEDIRPYVLAARCYIVPLRVGGGTRLKILDAWAMGKAVVSTSVGCEGLDARDGENILIADSPADFAAAVERVLMDGELRVRLERNARATAEQSYSWTSVGTRMLATYGVLLEVGGARSASAEAVLG